MEVSVEVWGEVERGVGGTGGLGGGVRRGGEGCGWSWRFGRWCEEKSERTWIGLWVEFEVWVEV